MKSVRVAAGVLIAALAACTADPIGPSSYGEAPSLFTASATDAGLSTAGACATAPVAGTVTGSSTYIVAYDCTQALVDTASATVPRDTALQDTTDGIQQ
jgi:hypothetical protein